MTRPQHVEDLYPLSPAQQGMLLFLLLQGYRAEVYFEQYVATLGDLDPAAWRRAWERVVARHAALRTHFAWERRDQPLQVVRRTVELPWREEDWRALPAGEREARLAAFLREDHVRGFDLDRAPLLRFALFRFADDEWRFVWSFSHLVLDGWSIALVLGEAVVLYSAEREGRETELPPAPPYRDYIAWLRRQDPVASAVPWREALAGFDPPTPLPFDGTGGGAPDTASVAAEVERVLSAATFERLRTFVRRHQLTPNTLFQGLWGLLLGRCAAARGDGGRDAGDVVFGAVVSGRPYEIPGVESIVGLFINAVPVRVQVDPGAELLPWLRRLQDEQFALREHEHWPLEQVQTWAGMPRQVPLFESLLVYENYPADPLGRGAGGRLEIRDAHLAEAGNYPLTLYVVPRGEELALKLSYHWRRFGAAEAERLLGCLESLLAAVLERPHTRLGDLPLVSPAEAAALAAASAGPTAPPPAVPVHRLFAAQAARTPDAVAVASRADSLTYAELARAARRLAGRLRAHGVAPESIVGLCAERSPEMVAGLLGVLEAGGAYLPLDPAYPPQRLAFMLEDSGARVLLVQGHLLPRLAGSLPAGVVVLLDGAARDLEEGGTEPPADSDPEAALDRLAYVIYTSGSTGTPKGVLVAHRSLAAYAETAAAEFALAPGDRVLQFASISFDTSAEEIYPCLARGATLVLRDDEMIGSLARFLRDTEALGVTVLDLPTAYWHELVAAMEAEGLELPAAVRLVILGGEQAQRDRLAAWRARVGERVRLLNTYGPTEATIVATRRALAGPGAAPFAGEAPIGRPIENARAYVAGATLDLLPAGMDGELLLGGAGLARGYLGRPDLTAERFVPDPFSGVAGVRLYRTGDRARLESSGDLEFRGRTDQQVKVRGYRIELGEIEAALRVLPAVREAVALARPAAEGQRLVAFVVPREGMAPSPAELRAALQSFLPDHMVPSAFGVLLMLPLTPSGKVDRRALAQLEVEEGRLDLGEGDAPRTPAEEMLAGIWSDLLGVERVGVHDDFFQLGGHSLLVARLAARVRQAFRVELPMVEVFKEPTIAALARAVERAESAGEVPGLPPVRRAPRDRPIPLSFPQERVWFLEQLAPGNIAYNFQVTLWFRGPLDVEALRRTLEEIVRRHEVLRTSFPAVDGRPVQRIHAPAPLELPVVDLRGVPAAERHEVSERLVAETVRVPFDLSRLPLVRWRLLRLEDDLHELIQVEHHFVHDGWSFAVMLREMEAIYPAFAAGRPSPLPEPPIQYADFAVWQREVLEGEGMEHLLGYWRRRLAGNSGVLELPSDRPRPARQSFRGDLELFNLPPDLYEDLRALGRREGFTLYMTMAAAFFALLSRYTGQEDVLLGTSNANRRARELEGMIGMVVNTLLLRGDLSGDPPFRTLLERVRQTTLEAYAHQDMPFERLVQELRPERQLGRNPLFQVMFNFHDAPVPDLQFGNVEVRFLVRGNRSAKMDMNVIVIPRAEQRVGRGEGAADRRAILHWEYSTELFDPETIRRMVGHYLTLLEGIVADSTRRLSELPLLTAPERRQLVEEWNPRRAFAADACLHELFAAQAARTPDAVAVVTGGERLTYRELDERADRLAHRLRARGVRAETPVGLCVERSAALVVGILGILKAGGGYVPLDPSYPAERLRWILEDALRGVAAPLVVTEEALAEILPEHGAEVVYLEALAGDGDEGPPLPAATAAPDNLAYVIYTSGSTGKPKGVPITHRHVARLFAATDVWFGFGPDDVWTLFHSFAFDFSVWELWGALLYGGRLIVVPYLTSRTPEIFYELLADERVTVLNQTPSAFRQLIAAEEAAAARGAARELALRCVVFGGEALDFEALRPWLARHGEERPRLINMYGITETTVHVTYRPVALEDLAAARNGRVGVPIPDLTVHLLDRHSNLVPAGVPGEIHVGGAGLSAGYLHRPDLTAERFVPDPFASEPGARLYRSGDLARRRPDGDLEYLERIDHQVKVRGFRIELGEIEAALLRHGDVREAVVLARPDPAGGDTRLLAYLVPRDGRRPAAAELHAELKQVLPEYMVPSAFVLLDALPLTAHGKVDRRALPEPDLERRAAGGEYVPPRTPVEEALAEIWTEVLAVERVGVRDDFFLLGGHSLSAARVLARVRERLRAELPLAVLFEQPTIEALAAAVAARPAAGEAVAAPIAALHAEAMPDALRDAATLPDEQLDALLGELLLEHEVPGGER